MPLIEKVIFFFNAHKIWNKSLPVMGAKILVIKKSQILAAKYAFLAAKTDFCSNFYCLLVYTFDSFKQLSS